VARIVVIGAGVGGLAAAARLAAKRHDVTVVERSGQVGGKLQTWTSDGFSFDVGPSLFTIPAVYRDLFLKTGAPLEQEVELVETEPGFRYAFADSSTLQLPGASVGRTANTIAETFGADAGASWTALMQHAAAVWRLSRDDVLGTPLESRRQFARLARSPRAVRTIAPWQSLSSLARRRLDDPRLRDVVQRYATYSGSRPAEAPSALVTIPFVESTFGLWHITGGLGGLATAIERRAVRAGASIRLGSEVTRIHHEDSGVTAVTTQDGERLPADIVVSDMDSRWLPDLLGSRPERDSGQRSYSGFAVLLAVEGHTAALAHHNVWFPPDYAREFSDLRAGRPPADPAIYVCRPDDPHMAPPGCEAWFVLVNAPRQGTGGDAVDWRADGVAERYADHVIDLLARRGADVRDRIRWRRIQTPADLADRDGSRDGAIYGNAGHGMFAPLRRARNVGPIPGLFVVGGTAHPGGGLPLVGMGAESVADRIGRARP
jgi:phytoene desaturase